MLLWPEHNQTSPNRTPVTTIVMPVVLSVAVMLCVVKPAGVGGSNKRHEARQELLCRERKRFALSCVPPAHLGNLVRECVLQRMAAAEHSVKHRSR